MVSEILFHFAILVFIALITILPAGYVLKKHKNNRVIFPKNRRDVIWTWILPSSLYLSYVAGEHGINLIGEITVAVVSVTIFTLIISLPYIIKHPTSFTKKYRRWLEE